MPGKSLLNCAVRNARIAPPAFAYLAASLAVNSAAGLASFDFLAGLAAAIFFAGGGGGGGSGAGSRQATTAPYRHILERLLVSPQIASVVDVGCGDWQLGSLVDWSSVSYIGIDAAALDAALDDPTTHDEIREDHQRVIDAGGFGVPTLFLSGQCLFGPVLVDPPTGPRSLRLVSRSECPTQFPPAQRSSGRDHWSGRPGTHPRLPPRS